MAIKSFAPANVLERKDKYFSLSAGTVKPAHQKIGKMQ
jgi:hypothetical protein